MFVAVVVGLQAVVEAGWALKPPLNRGVSLPGRWRVGVALLLSGLSGKGVRLLDCLRVLDIVLRACT